MVTADVASKIIGTFFNLSYKSMADLYVKKKSFYRKLYAMCTCMRVCVGVCVSVP